MQRATERWGERKAEETVAEFLERELLPEEVARDAATHLEDGDPLQALEIVLEHCHRDSRSGEPELSDTATSSSDF